MKKIAIDARMVFPHPHGVARYVKNIAFGLADLLKKRTLSYEPIFLVDPRFSALLPSDFKTIPIRARYLAPGELLEIPKVLKLNNIQLYHSPSLSSLACSPCPWIATVHDLNHLQFGNLKQKIYYQTLLKRFSNRAAALLTVSEFSKTEIHHWLKNEKEIEIVPNALDPTFERTVQNNLDEERRFAELVQKSNWDLKARDYFICLSNPKPHKNLPFLITAYLEAQAKARALDGKPLSPLVLTARKSDLPAILVRSSDLVFTSELQDEETRLLLSFAKAAFFPSLYEGFGLPPLESIVSGTPILVSDIPPHHEGLQDFSGPWVKWLRSTDQARWIAAILVEKGQPGLESSSEFLKQRKNALERFSVGRLAEHMDRIYSHVLERIL